MKRNLHEQPTWRFMKEHIVWSNHYNVLNVKRNSHKQVIWRNKGLHIQMKSQHQCGGGFKSDFYLKSHERTHTGEKQKKPVCCSQCSMKFALQLLWRVMTEPTHTDEKRLAVFNGPRNSPGPTFWGAMKEPTQMKNLLAALIVTKNCHVRLLDNDMVRITRTCMLDGPLNVIQTIIEVTA